MRHLIQKWLLIISIIICSCHGGTIRGGSANVTAARYSLAEMVPSMEAKRKLQDDELRFCYNALFASDANDDRVLDRSEYITFIDLIGGPSVDTYSALPIVFRSSFSILACRCLEEPNAAPDCCVGSKGRVSNAGAGPGESPTKKEEQNLYHVCFLSESSVEKFFSELEPTTPPTKAPTKVPTPPPPTKMPTSSPTEKPTEEAIPTATPTPGPTPNPTVAPTETPTIRPTFAPNPFPTTPLPTVSPTFKPTQTPTPAPTITSSESPTVMESGVPTVVASGTPSAAPTTALPSGVPSIVPSVAPSVAPSGAPSGLPSVAPTQGPTGNPSDLPTVAPSISSAPSSSAAPTGLPSAIPSLSPSRTPPDETIETTYVIAVRGSAVLSEYESDLIASMNLLAGQVSNDVSGRTAGRRRLVSVSVFNPTSLTSIDSTDCPDNVESNNDRCESVTANVGLYIDEEEVEGSSVTRFKEILEASIENGELQDSLDFVNKDSPVYIVTGRPEPVIPRGREPEDSSLSTGVISGIVVAGVVGMLISYLLMQKGKYREDHDDKEDFQDLEGMAAGDPIMVDTSEVDHNPKKKKRSPKSDESSNAGDSGWSSHGGMSSLDTASVDDVEYRTAALGGAALAGGAIAGGALDKEEPTSPTDGSNDLKMTYSELDDAIQQGDWAAVGVTAALLASQSYETGGSNDSHRLSIDNATLNPSRAAELDRLVEAGDWEGVVAAAAKFDAQEATTRIDRGESASRASSSDVTSNASGSIASSGSPSNSEGVTAGATSTSESGSARKLDEIRKEVDELVRQVVPEEQDNVDEMMLQFQGREEELVETLRSMQERQVVHKARIEGQKKAKRDAREQVESSKKQGDGETGAVEEQTKTDVAEGLNALSNTDQEDDHFEDDDDEGSV